MIAEKINALLDELPRTRVGRLSREAPVFRTCGITGFYLALIALFGGGLLAGRSLIVLAALALVSGLSFFAYTYLRMWITGREELVLLEHVWFALAACALVLRLMGEPILPYLDVVSVALCPFLAMGRVGCTLVGCCHGKPASIGIVYGADCAQDGFPGHLVGVRLFPVPAIEAIGLLSIGMSGLIALPLAQPGSVFAWYLVAYSIMRFGLEGLRGDTRPHLLGLSQARWMAIIEVGLALGLGAGGHAMPAAALYVTLGLVLLLVLAYLRSTDWHHRLLSPSHLGELRELVMRGVPSGPSAGVIPMALHTTSHRVGVTFASAGTLAHVSLSLPDGRGDLPLLCELSTAAFPSLQRDTAQLAADRVLHFKVPIPWTDSQPERSQRQRLGLMLYGDVLRRKQCEAAMGPVATVSRTVEPPDPAVRESAMMAQDGVEAPRRPASRYFTVANGSHRA